jgi:hypothetical protein
MCCKASQGLGPISAAGMTTTGSLTPDASAQHNMASALLRCISLSCIQATSLKRLLLLQINTNLASTGPFKLNYSLRHYTQAPAVTAAAGQHGPCLSWPFQADALTARHSQPELE